VPFYVTYLLQSPLAQNSASLVALGVNNAEGGVCLYIAMPGTDQSCYTGAGEASAWRLGAACQSAAKSRVSSLCERRRVASSSSSNSIVVIQ